MNPTGVTMNVLNTSSLKAEEDSIVKIVTAGADVSLKGGQNESLQAVEPHLSNLHSNRKKWQTAREGQEKAEGIIRTIRLRREETQAQVAEMTEKFHAMFEETNGELTAELKKVRSEGMIAKDTVIEYDALLTRREDEFTTVPWATGRAAHDYIQAHNAVLKKHAHQTFRRFLDNHGAELFQALALIRLACRNDEVGIPDNSTGVYSGINDADSEFRRFLDASIYAPVQSVSPQVGNDEVLKETGIYPEPEAQSDVRLRPSPMHAHNHYVRKQAEAKRSSQQKDKR